MTVFFVDRDLYATVYYSDLVQSTEFYCAKSSQHLMRSFLPMAPSLTGSVGPITGKRQLTAFGKSPNYVDDF